ncbi:DNA primase [Cellulomonas sp. C5510]|uniref:DNA primase n=1 Tax=Cellulomonas sp. C5510 TaxID=2871170 RepID=UPI001C9603F5|nr:DNA primase [Cellulomonas sp. C5510]QZN84589.1 DNA primase [Cellulomonas sp. C5510]
MAGRIRREDVQSVRERARIEDVVGEHVALKSAGVGSMKGLCPFHDEKSPSFHVRPQVGLYHCFGCGEGGDVIDFIQKIDGLPFTEAVEYLAGRVGVQLRYEEGGGPRPGHEPGKRQRLLEAHRVAAEYYAEQLLTPGAATARAFLAERGFDRAAAEQFGVGYAPQGWDSLLRHLRGKGFTEAELTATGLMSQGNRGLYDRFRGRLVWPIREVTGDVVGFGARRLFDEDQGPKYLNTPETALYKKSQVLYGIDLAKREIAKNKQVVVVEGYTDVMAMHLSGVGTAVATCGTAFGSDHARVVRRLMGAGGAGSGIQLASGESVGGEVVFTFDGDSAGQKAAMRAFGEDQAFSAQTFVAVAEGGMDPCELRQAQGPDAVRALVRSRQPLFQFVIRTTLEGFDLHTAEGRVAALRAAAPIPGGIRDTALRPEYTRMLAGWLGMDVETVQRAVQQASRGGRGAGREAPRSGGWGERAGDRVPAGRVAGGRASGGGGGPAGPGGSRAAGDRWQRRDGGGPGRGDGRPGGGRWDGRDGRRDGRSQDRRWDEPPPEPYDPGHEPPHDADAAGSSGPGGEGTALPAPRMTMPDPRDPVASTERRALEAVLQMPDLVPPEFDDLPAEAFTAPAYRAVHAAVRAAGGAAGARERVGAGGPGATVGWVEAVREEAAAPVRSLVTQLAVAPLPEDRPDRLPTYARGLVMALVELELTRRIADLRGRLQRMDAVQDPDGYRALAAQLFDHENRRRSLRESA